jgi:PAS domain S-box-containing protein
MPYCHSERGYMIASPDLLDIILDSATHTGIIVSDLEGRIMEFNKGAVNLFGYSAQEAKGKNLPDLTYPKEDKNSHLFESIVERVKSAGWTEERLLRQHKNGRLFPALSTITALNDSNGEIHGILEIIQDMPALFRLEQELKSSKKFLENILESSIDAVVTTDHKGYITYVNRAFRELIGQRSQQIIGKHISIYYRAGIDQAREIMNKLRQFGRIRDYEFDIKVGEKIIPIRTSDTLLYDDYGEIVGTMGVFQDITARKKLSEELSATQAELIQAVKIRALGDLVTGVAHEINNPLMASDTFLHLLEETLDENPEQKKRVLLIKECNRRIHGIVKKLREFSRQTEVEFTAMDVNEAVQTVMEITRQQLLNQGIEVTLTLGKRLPKVLGDKNQIEQVLLNLISNAKDAMEGKSKKELTIETLPSQKGRLVKILVRDTGIGMSKDQIEKIFNPFFTTKDSDRGIGLGLSICYRIIEAHQGKIEVKSTVKKGTEFIVSLPIYLKKSKMEGYAQKAGGKNAA